MADATIGLWGVPLAVLGPVAHFLALLRKQVVPLAVPFSLWLPVVIEDPRWVVPVRHSDPAASRSHRNFANRACARKAVLGLSLLVINNRVFHGHLSSLPPAAITGCLRAVVAFMIPMGGGLSAACFILPGTRSVQAFVLLLGHRRPRALHIDSSWDVNAGERLADVSRS